MSLRAPGGVPRSLEQLWGVQLELPCWFTENVEYLQARLVEEKLQSAGATLTCVNLLGYARREPHLTVCVPRRVGGEIVCFHQNWLAFRLGETHAKKPPLIKNL